MLRLLLIALPLLLNACLANPDQNPGDGGLTGDGGTGTASLQGSLAFNVTSANEVHLSAQNGDATGFGFVLTDTALSCGQLQALDGGAPPVAYHQVFGGVGCVDGCATPGPGTYPVGAAGSAQQLVGFVFVGQRYPDAGATGPDATAQSGSITLTDSSTDALSGNFQVTVLDPNTGLQTTLQGTFDTTYCP
jgi:hypothetical protein